MDKHGHIFDVEEERERFKAALVDPVEAEREIAEAQARLDGYLRGRADSDRPNRDLSKFGGKTDA